MAAATGGFALSNALNRHDQAENRGQFISELKPFGGNDARQCTGKSDPGQEQHEKGGSGLGRSITEQERTGEA
jgi:hypothetical protein